MPRPKPKIIRPALAKAPTGIQGLDEVTGEVYRRVASPWYVGAQAVARAYSRWNSWCTALFDMANLAYAWTSKKPRRN
jgi:hypothetical protein